MTQTPKLFAVSTGDGNSGVSQLYPDYYVTTADPWRLARLATVDQFKPEHMQWAIDACDTDGEEDFTIYATIYDPPGDDGGDDGMDSWSANNGAWMCVQVFTVAEDDVRSGSPRFDSLEEAFTAPALAIVGQG